MRKKLLSTLVLAAVLPLTAVATPAAAAPTQTATVAIKPVVAGAIERASVSLQANPGGAGFTATGNGSGFNPISQYVSLVYGRNSVPVTTNGVRPCADDGTLGDPNTSTLRMFVGAWLPVVGGNRTMAGSQPTTTIDQINTMSLRRANVPLLPAPGDIRPQTFQLRSCGLVVKVS